MSHVVMRISNEMFFRHLLSQTLRLGDHAKVTGIRSFGENIITFDVETPDAPVGAVEMDVVYRRDYDNEADQTGTVTLVEIRWRYADGTETVQTVAAPLPVPAPVDGLAKLREAAARRDGA